MLSVQVAPRSEYGKEASRTTFWVFFHEVRVVAGELGLVGLAVDTLVVGTGLVDLLATEVEGDDGLEGVLDDGVARLVRGGVSEDVRAGGLDVEGAGALGGAFSRLGSTPTLSARPRADNLTASAAFAWVAVSSSTSTARRLRWMREVAVFFSQTFRVLTRS